jgi:hypothetical protein
MNVRMAHDHADERREHDEKHHARLEKGEEVGHVTLREACRGKLLCVVIGQTVRHGAHD